MCFRKGNGGVLQDSPGDCDVILASPEHVDRLTDLYAHQATQVREPSFVNKCLRRKMFFADAGPKNGMGGNTSG